MQKNSMGKTQKLSMGVVVLILFWLLDALLKSMVFSYASSRSRDLSNTRWENANLHSLVLVGYQLRGTTFSFCEMRGSSFVQVDGQGVKFFGTGLEEASFRNARLSGASFKLSNLSAADFRNASLEGAALQASLYGADFRGAHLENVDLTGSIYDKFTRWPANFRPQKHGASFSDFSPPLGPPRYRPQFSFANNTDIK